MAYCNINQFKAKKLIKARNITTIDQVERTFKSSAYFAWSLLGIDSEADSVRESSIASLRRGLQGRRRSKTISKRNEHCGEKIGSSLVLEENVVDQTLVPKSPMDQDNYLIGENPEFTANQLALVPDTDQAEPSAFAHSDSGMEALFPAPGLILNELFQLYQSKANVNERNLAIIDYLRLTFHKIK